MKARSLKIIAAIDSLFVILFIISLFMPYYYYPDPWDGYYYLISIQYYTGYTYGVGLIGMLFILASVIHLFKFSASRVLLYRILGLVFFGGVAIVGFIIYSSRANIGTYLGIAITAELFLTSIIIIATRASLTRSIKDDIRDYIFKISSTHDNVSLSRIANMFKISRKYVPKLRNYIDELIYDRVIYAKISGNNILFDKSELQRITQGTGGISEKPAVIEVDYKKRLYGMIRIRKEIDLEEASEFLNITPKQIESLLYDLAGEKEIQGNFEGNRFIITSDVENFIDVLDNSFSKWETDKRKLT